MIRTRPKSLRICDGCEHHQIDHTATTYQGDTGCRMCDCQAFWQWGWLFSQAARRPELAWYFVGLVATIWVQSQMAPVYADPNSRLAGLIFGVPLQLMVVVMCYLTGKLARMSASLDRRERDRKRAEEQHARIAREAREAELAVQAEKATKALVEAQARVRETPAHEPDDCTGPTHFPSKLGEVWNDGCASAWVWEPLDPTAGGKALHRQWVQRPGPVELPF